MEDIDKSKTELIAELQRLRDRLNTSEATLEAIQQGEVDALVVTTAKGPQIFTLKSADQGYRLLVEEMQQGAAIISLDGLITYANRSLASILMYPLEQLMGAYFQQFISLADYTLFQEIIQRNHLQERQSWELFLVRSDTMEIPIYLSIHYLVYDEISVKCLVVTDLTEQKRHEQTLAAERLARLILEQAGEAILVCDHQGQIIRASQAASHLWNGPLLFRSVDTLHLFQVPSSKMAMLPAAESEITPFSSTSLLLDRIPFSIQSVLAGESYQGLEVELVHSNGQILNLLLNARPLADASNHFTGAVIILTNITQRKQAERELRQAKAELESRVAERTAKLQTTITELEQAKAHITDSLKEKEVLLKEVHHRVKNNLGIVGSLLQMQTRRIQNPQAATMLRDSENRVASIAMVHEKLYGSDDLANIDCAKYIRDLTGYLFASYNTNSEKIKLKLQIENIYLDIETMISCGLIVNELVCNALKYAFPDNRTGEIQIILTQGSLASQPGQPQENNYPLLSTLIIKDNGIGLPNDVNIKSAQHLGLTLVQGLAKQIGGTIEIIRDQGTEIKLTFVGRSPG